MTENEDMINVMRDIRRDYEVKIEIIDRLITDLVREENQNAVEENPWGESTSGKGRLCI